MKVRYLIISFIFLGIGQSYAQSPLGKWINFHPEKGTPLSQIEFIETDKMIHAKISKIFDPDINPLCTECRDGLKNESLVGMTVIWNLTQKTKGLFKNGRILNPENGKIYRCIVELEDDNKMRIHGYIGCKFIGKSQYFTRASTPDMFFAATNTER